MLGQRRLPTAGILRLPFAHHVNHFDPAQDRPSRCHRLQPEHRTNSALDGTMILLDPIIEIGALSDPDRLHLAPRSVLEPLCRVAGHDRLPVGLAAVDHDPLWPAMPPKGSAQELLGGGQIAPLTEPEFDRIAVAVDRAIQIAPLAPDLDVGFVDMPSPGDGSLASIEALQQFGRVTDDPSADRCVINGDAELRQPWMRS